jgi:hypothetical protein
MVIITVIYFNFINFEIILMDLKIGFHFIFIIIIKQNYLKFHYDKLNFIFISLNLLSLNYQYFNL